VEDDVHEIRCFVDFVHLMEQTRMFGTFWFVYSFLFYMLLTVSLWTELLTFSIKTSNQKNPHGSNTAAY